MQPARRKPHGRGAVLLELGKGFQILRRDRRIELPAATRAVGAQRLAASAQDKIADRPPAEFLCPLATLSLTQIRVPQRLVCGF